jgi:NAD(P)-dependent dehydrogenase (short-subunit alcohol dehydrogenase family)
MKIAVVTGAGSGIGQAAAVRIAERGVGVIATYNTNPEGAHDTVATIEDDGGSAVALPLDVGSSTSFERFAQTVAAEIQDRWQRNSFDYLLNNAGFGQMAMFEDTSEELFDQFHRVILKGPYFLTQRLLPLLADGGAIVNTTSNSALMSGLEPGYSAYASMKGGLAVLSRYLAKELSVRGIPCQQRRPRPDPDPHRPRRVRPLPRGHSTDRRADRARPPRRGRRRRQGHRRRPVRRLRMGHRPEHRGLGRLQPGHRTRCFRGASAARSSSALNEGPPSASPRAVTSCVPPGRPRAASATP